MEITQRPSPNYSSSGYDKTLGVTHKTLGLMPGCLEWLTMKESQVSSNYLITKKGEIYQLVQDKDMAWHAGNVSNPSDKFKKLALKQYWGSYVNPNKYSIGIEFEALINDKWTKEQMEAGKWLVDKLNLKDWITHRDITSYKPYMDDWLNELLKPGDGDTPEEIKKQIINLVNKL